MSTTIFRKFWPIFCYCKLNSKVYKKPYYFVSEVCENRILVKIHKKTFFVLYLLISPTKFTFSLGENIGSTRHLMRKNEPTFDRFFFGVGCTVRPAGS